MSVPRPPAVGDEPHPLLVRNVREDDIRVVARILRDPNPIHFDRKAVVEAGLGDRPINQGGATMAFVMNFLTSWAGSRQALRHLECSFKANVAAGDDIEVGGRVMAVDPATDGLQVTLEVWADVVGGRRAVTGTATVLWQPGTTA